MKKKSGLLLILFALMFTSCVDKTEESQRYVREGNIYLYGTDLDHTLSLYEKAIDLDPKNSEAWYGVGLVWMNKRKYHKAIENFTKAIEIKPDYTDAYFNRGQAYFYLGENYKACDNWQRATDLGKPNMGDKLKKCL